MRSPTFYQMDYELVFDKRTQAETAWGASDGEPKQDTGT